MLQKNDDGAVGLLFSGGLDSSILLLHLLDQRRRVQPIYIHSDLVWQDAEFQAACGFLAAVDSPELEELVSLELPLSDIYEDHWSVTGRNIPAAGTPDEAVYLPGRNPLLLIKARLWCQTQGIPSLALGCLRSNPFADATDDFFDEFQTVLDRATSGSVEFVRPFAALGKREVMQLGGGYPLERTFSCLSPRAGLHCGECNKCDERRAAFRLADLADPTRYASRQPAN